MLFGGGEFQMWKLHTFGDYLTVFLYLLAGFICYKIAVRYLDKHRNDEDAVERVMRRLKKLAKRPSKIHKRAVLHLAGGDLKVDGVLMDKSGIYLVKAYGWGTKIYGTPDGETWRRLDAQRKDEFPNPLIELKKGVEEIRTLLEENGAVGVKVMPMVVFADNYQTPELYLGYGACSTTYQELKGWYRKQAGVKKVQYDFERVSSILSGIVEQ